MGLRKVGGKSKKILSVALAFVMIFSSGTGIYAYYNSKHQTPTSVSDGNDVNNGNDDSKEETFSPEGILYKPYSIKSDDEIQNILNEVEKLTGEKIDIRFIKCLYYEFLDKSNVLTENDFKGMSGEQFYEWFMEHQNNYYSSLNYGIPEYQHLKQAVLEGGSDDEINELKGELPPKITDARTAMPKEAIGYNSIQLELSKIINEEKKDIEEGNIEDFDENTEKLLNIMEEIAVDNTLSNGERYAAYQDIDTWLPIFALTVDKNNEAEYEKYKKLIPNFQSNLINIIYSGMLSKLRYTLPPSEETCTNRTEEEERHIKGDADSANNNSSGSTKNVPGRGNSNGNHSTYKDQVSSATTTTSTTTYVVNVPDKEDTTNKKPGGKPTGTTSTSTETTSHIYDYDYDVKPGVEYSDDSLNNGFSK